ncbi:MAG: hypothetical protein JSS70_20500 [Bacteroidetes bacterium]|nr:hypothetical protein [Bacteroidota bacterium]
MRTSNKILAGTLIVVLLILTGIHLALYAKYKNNDFITIKDLHEEQYDSYSLKGIQTVSLSGLQNVIIRSSDTARVEIEKGGDRKLVQSFANGILTIKGDTTIVGNSGATERLRSWRSVIIYLPLNQDIKSDDCEITIQGGPDSSKAPSITGEMNSTTLHFNTRDYNNTTSANYFNKVLLTKYSHGSLTISQSVVIKEANINMDSSSFEDNDASLGGININADSSSTLKLSGRNIAKTKFTLK